MALIAAKYQYIAAFHSIHLARSHHFDHARLTRQILPRSGRMGNPRQPRAASQFESFRQPFVILVSVPMALVEFFYR